MFQRVARRALGSLGQRIRRPHPSCLEALEGRRLYAATGDEIVFEDVGVGGTAPFHVSEPLFVSVAPFGNSADVDDPFTYDEVYAHTSGPLRTQIAWDL